MRISIIGTGYVGLVTGACLAEKGHAVACVDIDCAKVDMINRGIPPIHERGLAELLRKHAGHALNATADLESAVLGSDLTFIATGTPFDGNEIDLRYVRQAAGQVGAALKKKSGSHAVVVKSTVVPGTTDSVVLPLLEQASGKRAGAGFGVGNNPEFLSEGEAVADFMQPDRIVLGGMDERTQGALAEVYAPFGDDVPRLRTNNRTAEMIKYASNAFQATCISFSNEIGNLCAALGGIDVTDIMAGVHLMKELNPRAGRASITNFLSAGCGFGGSCFPKDVKALVAHANRSNVPMRVLQGVLDVNAHQPAKLIDLLKHHLGEVDGVPVTVLGLAFKPNTDDIRESPSIPVVKTLLAEGAVVTAYDPAAAAEAKKVLGDRIRYAGDLPSAIDGAKAIVIVTRWDEFKALPKLLAGRANAPLVVDGRRMLDKRSVPRYAGIGWSEPGANP
jgi:UDPglucose 6-dehydrogenase/GDP-mannose 6-dehydrogenase